MFPGIPVPPATVPPRFCYDVHDEVAQDVVAHVQCDLVAFALQAVVRLRAALCFHVPVAESTPPGLFLAAAVVVGDAWGSDNDSEVAATPDCN